MTAVICTREELPAASDPRSIAAAQLHRDRTHSASLTHDARGVSPEFRAFEEKFRQMGAEQIPEHNHGPQYLAMIKEVRTSWTMQFEIPMPEAATLEHVLLDDVDCYWVSWPHIKKWNSPEQQFIVYYHGGSFTSGGIAIQAGCAAEISRCFDLPLLFVEYALVPEALWPSQMHTTQRVHAALLALDSTCAARMITYGESAGGTLSLLHTQCALESSLPSPSLCITISPWADFCNTSTAYEHNKHTCIMMTAEGNASDVICCCGGEEQMKADAVTAANSSMSPFNHTFHGMPPVFVCAGGAEMLSGDSEMVRDACVKAGVDVTLKLGAHMCHNYMNFVTLFPEAVAEMAVCVAWVKQKTAEAKAAAAAVAAVVSASA